MAAPSQGPGSDPYRRARALCVRGGDGDRHAVRHTVVGGAARNGFATTDRRRGRIGRIGAERPRHVVRRERDGVREWTRPEPTTLRRHPHSARRAARTAPPDAAQRRSNRTRVGRHTLRRCGARRPPPHPLDRDRGAADEHAGGALRTAALRGVAGSAARSAHRTRFRRRAAAAQDDERAIRHHRGRRAAAQQRLRGESLFGTSTFV